MGKTLIIRDSDFSDVMVGSVDLPRDISVLAEKWINISGNTEMTNSQKKAIDTFISTLKNSGCYDKIDKIHLPMLATSVDKAFVDYKNLNDEATEELISYYTLRNHGIIGNNGNNMPKIDSTYTKNSNDLSLYVYNSEDYDKSISRNEWWNSVGNVHDSSVELRTYGATTGLQVSMYFKGTANTATDTNTDWNWKKLRGVSSNGTVISVLKYGGAIRELSYNSSYVAADYTGYSLLGINKTASTNSVAAGAFFVGSALTDTEAVVLQDAVDALAEVFVI